MACASSSRERVGDSQEYELFFGDDATGRRVQVAWSNDQADGQIAGLKYLDLDAPPIPRGAFRRSPRCSPKPPLLNAADEPSRGAVRPGRTIGSRARPLRAARGTDRDGRSRGARPLGRSHVAVAKPGPARVRHSRISCRRCCPVARSSCRPRRARCRSKSTSRICRSWRRRWEGSRRWR